MTHLLPFIAVTLGIAACVDTPPLSEPVVEASRVTIREAPETPRSQSDLLIVIDNTVAMAPYQDALTTLPARLADRLDWYTQRWIDLRVAVATNDGKLLRPSGTSSPWIEDAWDFDYTRRRNYDGTLGDALTKMMAVGTANDGPSQSLEAARHALETGSELMREKAGLMVLTISASDDASPLPVSDYAHWMMDIGGIGQTWWRDILVSGLYLQPASRLDEYYKSLPWWSIITPLDGGNFEAAIPWVPGGEGWSALGCYEADDLDPRTPELDHDCQMMASVNGVWRVLPECTPSETIERIAPERGLSVPPPACWYLRPDPQNCFYTSGHDIDLKGYTGGQHPALRLDCRTN